MTDADRSTIWPYDEHGDPGRFYYSRYDHPTGVAAETELGRREEHVTMGRFLAYVPDHAAQVLASS